MGKDEVLSAAGLMRARAAPSGGASLVLCAAEDVALFAAPLPLRAHRQRVSAAPFAIEEALAEPLAQVHVALGPMLAEGTYLVAATTRSTMQTWVQALDEAGLRRARLLPDVLTVPVPDAGEWCVLLQQDRALVRAGDGTGFAVPSAVFSSLWQGSGEPPLRVYGDAPDSWPLAAPEGPMPAGSAQALPRGFDLRQGAFAPDNRGGLRLRAAALVAVAGLAIHGGIMAYDAHALRGIAAERGATARARLAELSPGASPSADPVAMLARLAQPTGPVRRGAFLPLFARAAAALAPLEARMSFDTLVYSEAAGMLALGVRADDIATLQAVETALTGAGLAATSGPTTTAGGGATARIEVRDGGAS